MLRIISEPDTLAHTNTTRNLGFLSIEVYTITSMNRYQRSIAKINTVWYVKDTSEPQVYGHLPQSSS